MAKRAVVKNWQQANQRPYSSAYGLIPINGGPLPGKTLGKATRIILNSNVGLITAEFRGYWRNTWQVNEIYFVPVHYFFSL